MVTTRTTTSSLLTTITTTSQILSITTSSTLTTTTTINMSKTTTSSQTLTTTMEITTTQPILTNYYIQFSLSLNISDENITETQIISQLISIFTTALNIQSNQLNIAITTDTTSYVVAQIRFFSTNTESADDLLTQTENQLGNSSSKIRQQSLTSELNENSIENVQRYYICSNGIVQQSSCTTSETSTSTLTSTSTPGSSLSVILIASIIPSVIGVILFIVLGYLVIKYIQGPSLKVRTSRFDRF
jgi:hypothetical protein